MQEDCVTSHEDFLCIANERQKQFCFKVNKKLINKAQQSALHKRSK